MRMRTPNDLCARSRTSVSRVIPLGERHLRRTIAAFVDHYHQERNHQASATNSSTLYFARLAPAVFVAANDLADSSTITIARHDGLVIRQLGPLMGHYATETWDTSVSCSPSTAGHY